MLSIYGWGIAFEIALSWLSQGFADDKSTLVQVMAWCRQATSHYLSQCWPSSLSPYGVTRPQWVKVGINHTTARSGVCNRYVTFQIVGNSRISSLFDRFIPLHITIKNKSQEIEVVDFLYLNTIYLNSMDMRTDTFPYWMKDHVSRFGHIM